MMIFLQSVKTLWISVSSILRIAKVGNTEQTKKLDDDYDDSIWERNCWLIADEI